jgi:hypothetical protein
MSDTQLETPPSTTCNTPPECKCVEKDAQIVELQASIESVKAELEVATAIIAETITFVEAEKKSVSDLTQANKDLTEQVTALTQTISEKDALHLEYVRTNELITAGVPEDEVKTLIANFGTSSDTAWVELKKIASKNPKTSTAGVLVEDTQDINLSLDHSDTKDQLTEAIAAALKK